MTTLAPPVKPRALYARPARRGDGAPTGKLLAAGLPLVAVLVAPAHLPPWAAMWAIAFGVFFGCKVLTWLDPAGSARGVARRRQALAYFFAWPGMEPAAFLRRAGGAAPPLARWAGAVARLAVGVVLVHVAVPLALRHDRLLAGWLGMTGLVLVLHFGALDLLSLFWQARGVPGPALMNAPTRATSLADFWANRWNTAFHALARRYVFAPLRRPLGPAGAMLATFLASGLVHDLVISVPARGGLGLPTLYFLIQGAAVLLERSPPGRRAGLGRGLPGRLFAAVVLIAPLSWLFHEPFVARVVLPFLEAVR